MTDEENVEVSLGGSESIVKNDPQEAVEFVIPLFCKEENKSIFRKALLKSEIKVHDLYSENNLMMEVKTENISSVAAIISKAIKVSKINKWELLMGSSDGITKEELVGMIQSH